MKKFFFGSKASRLATAAMVICVAMGIGLPYLYCTLFTARTIGWTALWTFGLPFGVWALIAEHRRRTDPLA